MRKVVYMFAALGVLLGILVVINEVKTPEVITFHAPKLEENGPFKQGALLRLNTTSGRFQCSATVISDELAITAAHCGKLGTEFLATDDREQRPTNVVVVRQSVRMDISILQGDFKKYNKVPIYTRATQVVSAILQNPLIACGYPQGGEVFCTPINNLTHNNFEVAGSSWFYPGMSGGPVFDANSGVQVGVIVSVEGTVANFIPTVEVFRMLGIIEK